MILYDRMERFLLLSEDKEEASQNDLALPACDVANGRSAIRGAYFGKI